MAVSDSGANKAVSGHDNSQMAEEKSAGSKFPMELLNEIGENMGLEVGKLRLLCRDLDKFFTPMLAKKISDNKKVYATAASTSSWLALASTNWAHLITHVTVVGETFREHEYGYDWAWELAQDKGMHQCDESDNYFINEINVSHCELAASAQRFVTSGTYRVSLGQILCNLPNLNKVTIQSELAPGEHIPGWDGVHMLPRISGIHKLDLKHVFYGTWQYDTKHKTVTRYVDEYGEEVQSVQDPGPQAGFYDDVAAALEARKVLVGFTGEVDVVTA